MIDQPTNQDAYCHVNNQTLVCNKAQGIPNCDYSTGSEAACARAVGDPLPTSCDCN